MCVRSERLNCGKRGEIRSSFCLLLKIRHSLSAAGMVKNTNELIQGCKMTVPIASTTLTLKTAFFLIIAFSACLEMHESEGAGFLSSYNSGQAKPDTGFFLRKYT